MGGVDCVTYENHSWDSPKQTAAEILKEPRIPATAISQCHPLIISPRAVMVNHKQPGHLIVLCHQPMR